MPTTFAAHDENGQIPSSPTLVVPNVVAAFLLTALLELKVEPRGTCDPYKVWLKARGHAPSHVGIKERHRTHWSDRVVTVSAWAAEHGAQFGWIRVATP